MSWNETAFEEFIANWLVTHGGYQAVKNDWEQGPLRDFDVEHGLERPELFTFIGATQAEAWAQLVKRRGGDSGRAQREFLARLTREIDGRGTVDVLRHGVVDQGLTI